MSQKHMPRLGSAIASTILSVFSAVSLVGVDKAQAAVLHYEFSSEGASGFFKVDNSSVTGIGVEAVAVSEGRLDTFLNLTYYLREQAKEYWNLAGFTVLFNQGVFRGLQASDGDYGTKEHISSPDEPGEPYSFTYRGTAFWSISTNPWAPDIMSTSYFGGYREVYNISIMPNQMSELVDRYIVRDDPPVYYTLVGTEPVPEPLTAGGTALALAGLSWLKHKKKMAA
jgi:hypothetical protein